MIVISAVRNSDTPTQVQQLPYMTNIDVTYPIDIYGIDSIGLCMHYTVYAYGSLDSDYKRITCLSRDFAGPSPSPPLLPQKVYTAMPTSAEVTDYVDLVRHDKDATVIAKLKISVFLERPGNMRKCG